MHPALFVRGRDKEPGPTHRSLGSGRNVGEEHDTVGFGDTSAKTTTIHIERAEGWK
jgi:hypothetical protein